MVYGLSSRNCFCNCDEFVGLEAGAAHQRPIDVRIGEKFGSIGRSHRAAVQDTDRIRALRAKEVAQRRTDDLLVDSIGILSTGGFSGPDRPNRLVCHDKFRRIRSCDRRRGLSQ